jgi:hypothetical protein
MCVALVFSSLATGAEARENFALSVENNRRNREESWGETCGHCKRLGLPGTTLNTIFAMKNDIREQKEMW